MSFKYFGPLENTADAIRSLGRHLMEIGNLSAVDFEAYIIIELAKGKSEYIRKIEAKLDTYLNYPKWMTNYISRQSEAIKLGMQKKEAYIPIDLVAKFGVEQTKVTSRKLIYKFGKLLTIWPDMLVFAAELKNKENSLERVQKL